MSITWPTPPKDAWGDHPLGLLYRLREAARERQKTDQHPVRWKRVEHHLTELIADLGNSFSAVNLTPRSR